MRRLVDARPVGADGVRRVVVGHDEDDVGDGRPVVSQPPYARAPARATRRRRTRAASSCALFYRSQMQESFETVIVNGTVVAGSVVAPATVAVRDGRIAALLDPAARPAAARGDRRDRPARAARPDRYARAHASPGRGGARGFSVGHGRGGGWRHHDAVRDADLEGAGQQRRHRPRACRGDDAAGAHRFRALRRRRPRESRPHRGARPTPASSRSRRSCSHRRPRDSTSSSACGAPTIARFATSCAPSPRPAAATAFTASTRRCIQALQAELEAAGRTHRPRPRREPSRHCRGAGGGAWCWRSPPRPTRSVGVVHGVERRDRQAGRGRARPRRRRHHRNVPAVSLFHRRSAGPARAICEMQSAAAVAATRSIGLWEALHAGQIDYIGTDHSPFLGEEKAAACRQYLSGAARTLRTRGAWRR